MKGRAYIGLSSYSTESALSEIFEMPILQSHEKKSFLLKQSKVKDDSVRSYVFLNGF